MALSYWDKNFPGVRRHTTEKMYYNRYAYRIEFWVPRRTRYGYGHDFEEALITRDQWWRRIRDMALSAKKSPEEGIKVRQESSAIQIYAETEDQLRNTLDLLIKEFGVHFVRLSAVSISLPDPSKPLVPGIRYVKTKPRFRYEVKIRSRAFYEHRDSIRKYIHNLGPDTARIRGTFPLVVLTDDLANLDFLRLVVPESIGQIIELVEAG